MSELDLILAKRRQLVKRAAEQRSQFAGPAVGLKLLQGDYEGAVRALIGSPLPAM